MLQVLYIIAFIILAVLALGNLVRSMFALGIQSQRSYTPGSAVDGQLSSRSGLSPHPELLDERGQVINEPLLVMRSMTVEDAREQLDALYQNSPNATDEV